MSTNKSLIIVRHDINNSGLSLAEFTTTTTICYESLCDCAEIT